MFILVTNSRFATYGGTERFVCDFINYMKKKHDVNLLTLSVDKKLFDFDIPVMELGEPIRNFELRTITNCLKFLNYKPEKFDAIMTGLAPSSFINSNTIPLIQYRHTMRFDFVDGRWNFHQYKGIKAFYETPMDSLIYRWEKYLDRSSLKRSFVVANSVFTKKRLKKTYGVNSTVKYYGIDTSKFYSKSKGNFILNVGRLWQDKRVEEIIEVLPHLPAEIKLCQVGGGSEKYKKKLLDLAKRLKVSDRVIFAGETPYNEMIKFYSRCFCVVQDTMEEDFGYVPIEAMACGKPVICRNEGGYKETVADGKTGFLFNSKNQLVEKISTLFSDTSMYRRVAKKARVYVKKNFELRDRMKDLEELIKNQAS